MGKSVAIIGTRGYPSYYGGFETAVRRLAPFLVNEGWDVTVYGRPGTTNNHDAERDPRVHVKTTWGIERKSLSTLSYGLTSTLHASAKRPDVALVMNVANGFYLPLLRARGIPSLVNVDGIEWDRDKWGKLAKAIFHQGARATARHGDRMVYDSEEIGRRWASEFGVNGDFIPYGGDVPGSLPLEPGLRHRGYALIVARFVPENTLPQFILAAEEIARTSPVVFVGSSGYGGEFDDAVRKLSQCNPNVHWLGHVSDDRRLFSLWQHAGAYFHGHSVGGTNPALVQAMACGAPTVARDTTYNREVLGDAGRFCAPTPGDIARTVSQLLADPGAQDRMSTAAEQRAIEHYNWDDVCRAYDRSLKLLVAGSLCKS